MLILVSWFVVTLLVLHAADGSLRIRCLIFLFIDTATTEVYTLCLHDSLPISPLSVGHPVHIAPGGVGHHLCVFQHLRHIVRHLEDRKSTRLNSSHVRISYAVFCLKKIIGKIDGDIDFDIVRGCLFKLFGVGNKADYGGTRGDMLVT